VCCIVLPLVVDDRVDGPPEVLQLAGRGVGIGRVREQLEPTSTGATTSQQNYTSVSAPFSITPHVHFPLCCHAALTKRCLDVVLSL
jgi:hypothetical protein